MAISSRTDLDSLTGSASGLRDLERNHVQVVPDGPVRIGPEKTQPWALLHLE